MGENLNLFKKIKEFDYDEILLRNIDKFNTKKLKERMIQEKLCQ